MFVETDCTIEHNGQTFEAGGAVITDDYATAYLASEALPTPWVHSSGRESWYARKTGTAPWRGTLTDWHGNKIGTYVIKSRRHMGYREWMYYISATINGRDYYGQTQGPGMYVNLRAYKHQ